jgi:site-specific DNA-methyltransferase (adenine-specific)
MFVDALLTHSYLTENTVHHGRSEILMQRILPSSISLSFWSPPYFVGKEYEKEETFESWQQLLRSVIHHHFVALKPGGFLVINMSDIKCFKDESIPRFQAMNISLHKSKVTREMVLEAKRANPGFNRQQLAKLLDCSEQTIDRRLNGNNIRGGKHAIQTRVHTVGGLLQEYGYECGLYLYDHRIWVKDPSWANSKWTTNTLKSVDEYEDIYVFWKPGEQVINRKKLSDLEWRDWGLRGVWYINSVRANDDHEAKFPIELASRVIRLFSETNDLVLDPFMGSGTTGIAAVKNNRRFIGIEKEQKYVNLAIQNIRNAGGQIPLNM